MIHLRKLLKATDKCIVELRIEISNEGRPSASSDNLSVETNRIGAPGISCHSSSSFLLCRTTNVAKPELLLPPRLVCKGNAAATTTYVAKRDLPHLPHLSGGNRPVNASLNGDLDQDKSLPITRHVIARHAAPFQATFDRSCSASVISPTSATQRAVPGASDEAQVENSG